MKESVSWEKDTPIFKTWRIIGPYNRTTVHESVDFASSVYCKRVSCLGMHINSLRIFGICMKFWFILCPRHAECFYIYINFFFCTSSHFLGGFTICSHSTTIFTSLAFEIWKHSFTTLKNISDHGYPLHKTWTPAMVSYGQILVLHQSSLSIAIHCSLPILHVKRPYCWVD